MSRRRTANLLHVAAILAAAAPAACSSAPVAPAGPKGGDGPASAAPDAAPLSPARYFVTQSQGAAFDDASKGAAIPRREHAIVLGRRVELDGGAIVASARTPSGLVGFRSLPERLGGGYLVWSDHRTYHAKDFLGALTPIAEVGPTAGARPWFGTVLLRSERGIFELDPATRKVQRWRSQPGVVDALAIDDRRGVVIDVVGRVRATTDAGKTWTDVTRERGFVANGARLGKKGEIELVSLTGQAELLLAPGGSGVEPVPPPPPPYKRPYYGGHSGYYPYSYVPRPPQPEDTRAEPFSQTLAPDALGWAAGAGLLLSGGRALVGRDGGLFMLSTRTGGELSEVPLLDVEARYAGCQPVRVGSTVLLACAHAEGAQVMVLDGAASKPRLEATFPDIGGFVADDGGHLAFLGRCGRTPPSVDDFGARVAPRPPYEEIDPYGYGASPYSPYGPYGGYDPGYNEYPEPLEKEKPPADDKRVCVRLDGGDWIEHRLRGDDARDLYRWVIGDDGQVTALVLEGANPKEEEEKPEGAEDDPDESLRKRMLLEEGRAAPRGSSLLAVPPPPPPPATPVSAGKPAAKPAASARPVSAGKPAAPAKPSAKPPAKPAASARPLDPPPSAATAKVAAPRESLRVIRLDPKDRLLKHGKWTHVAAPLTQAPWRSIDRTFWVEDDGSVRGWVRLDDEGGSGGASYDEGGDRPSPVSSELSGRFAGVRISPQGKTTVLPLPRDTQSVVFGGRFGFARAEDDSGERVAYFETTDGGATWIEVEGPPVGDLEDAYDEARWPACSALGCALSSSLVRVGWGSAKPTPPKKEKGSSGSAVDPAPVPRLPRLQCTFDGEPEAFPAKPPQKAPAKPSPPPKTPAKPATAGLDEDFLSKLPPDVQEAIRSQNAPLGLSALLPPGLLPTASPAAPPSPPKTPAKPPAAAKPPPPPPAEVVSVRTRPQSPLGQLRDKSWVADFVVPFDPAPTQPKHVSIAANGLEKLQGTVVPLLGDRGVDLLLSFDKRRTVLGAPAPSLAPFEHNGRFVGAIAVPGPGGKAAGSTILALDEDRRTLVLLAPDASRPVLRTAKVAEPSRGRFTIARRLDAPGAALIWYSALSGEVLAGPIDLGRAEIGPLAPLASVGALVDGGLQACAATAKPAVPTYELVLDLALPVTVAAHSGKTLFTESTVPTSLLVRATSERLCVTGVEVRGGGKPLDLTATFGPRAAAVARSRASADDPTKLTLEKLSCLLKEPDPR